MNKHLYYTSVLKRGGVIGKAVIDLSMLALSVPKMVLDVFLRRNMGERYLSMLHVSLAALSLFLIPRSLSRAFGANWEPTTLYYIFVAAYVIMAVVRFLEIRRGPNVYDFTRYSQSDGESYGFFFKIKVFGKTPARRTIDIYFEPLLCLIVGILMVLVDQVLLGMIIIFCSFAYWFTNMMAARIGHHFVLDKIDEIICNQDISESFARDEERSPRGVPFYFDKPSTQELREKLARAMKPQDEVDVW